MHVLDNTRGTSREGLVSRAFTGRLKGRFPMLLVTPKRTLERRQGAQDLALDFLGPWAGLIGMLPPCGWSPREELEGMRRAQVWWSEPRVLRYGDPGTPSQAPPPLDKNVVFMPVV